MTGLQQPFNTGNLSYNDLMMLEQLQQQSQQSQQLQQMQQLQQAKQSEELQSALAGNSNGSASAPSNISSTVKTEDGKNDGHIGFFGALKAIGKGVTHFVTGMFTDKNGKFSLGQTLKTVAIGAGIAAVTVLTAGTAVPVLIAGAGIAVSGMGLAKSAYKIATAKTDAEDEAAWEGVGSNGVALAASAIGAKGAMKAYNSANGIEADYSGIKGTYKAVKDTAKLSKNVAVDGFNDVKNAYKAGGIDGVTEFAKGKYGTLKETMSNNWESATNPVKSREDVQSKDLNEYDTKIKNAQEEAGKEKTGTKEYAKANTKLSQLQDERTAINDTYNKFNKFTSLEDANKQIEQYESELTNKKSELANATDDTAKENIKAEIVSKQKQIDVAKSITKSKTNEVRDIRSEVNRLDKEIAAKEKSGKDVTALNAKKVKLEATLKENGFNVPGKAEANVLADNHSQIVKAAIEKQAKYNKLQNNINKLENEANKAPQSEKPALEAKLQKAKEDAQTALDELNQVQKTIGSAQRMVAASTNRNIFSTLFDKYVNGVKSTYGSEYDFKIPFSKHIVPGYIAAPASYASIFSGSEIEPQENIQTQNQNPFGQVSDEDRQSLLQQYAA